MYEESAEGNSPLDLEILAEKYLLLLYRCLLNDGLTPQRAEEVLSEVFSYIKKHPATWMNHHQKISVRLIQLCRHFSNRYVTIEKKVIVI
ncbi:hypothetical protein [Falsibacillus pallidus]|uniref:hypothetical protein n=1 Tax=Falsibacillus pallidus TaxID=493781 RepID=UPI003D97186D